jgi:hypothetical protein
MQLNKVLEKISSSGEFDSQTKSTFIQSILPVFSEVMQFEFGSVDGVCDEEWEGLAGYAIELNRYSEFKLPFKIVSYSVTFEGIDAAIVARETNTAKIEISAFFVYGGNIYVNAGYIDLEKSRRDSCVSSVCLADLLASGRENGGAEFGKLWSHWTNSLCALTCMLQAQGVSVATEQKLGKFRAASGRKVELPKYELRKVIITVGDARYSVSGKEIGVHSSPRLHWRRGHFRKLASGKTVHVRPCLVGDVSKGRIDREGYLVKRPTDSRDPRHV